jgi:hypothetical protein
MSNIDLSKAKIGDKFRTRGGCVVEYVKYENLLDLYIVSSENGNQYPVQKDGRYLRERECFSDLIVQVLDKPLDGLIEEATKQFRENDDAIVEEKECICYYAEKHDSAEIAYVSYIHRTVGLYIEYDDDDENHLLTLNSFDGTEFKIKINYCPMCGRKLTE